MGGYANGGDAENATSATDPQTRLGGDGGPYVLTTTETVVIAVTIFIFLLALFLVFYYRKLKARRKFDMLTSKMELENGHGNGDGRGDGEVIELKDGDQDRDRHRAGSASASSSSSSSKTTIGHLIVPRPKTPPAKPTPAVVVTSTGGEEGTAKTGAASVPEDDPFTTPPRGSSIHYIPAQGISFPSAAVIATQENFGAGGRPSPSTSTSIGRKPPPLWKYVHWKKGGPNKKSNVVDSLLPQVEPRRGDV